MAFRRQRALSSILLFFCIHLASGASSGNATWCMQEDNYDAYGVALRYLDVQSMREPQLDQLIQDVFGRMGCQQLIFEDNVTCENCLTASNIFTMLNITSGSSLTEQQFRNASTVIVSYLYSLHDACYATISIDWNQVTYNYFTNIILSLPDGASNSSTPDSSIYLSEHQLENMLRGISAEYLPGENVSALSSCDGGMKTQAAVRDLCSFENVKSFSSMDVETLTNPKEPENGIHVDELGLMNSIVFSKLISGECISRVEEGVPVAEEFIRALCQMYAEPDSCVISVHGLEEMAAALSIGGSSGDHSHGGHVLPAPEPSRKRRETSATLDEESHSHSIDVKTTCLTMEDILISFGFEPESALLSKTDFSRLCPSLVQQAIQGCPNAVDEQTTRPSDAETYVYGTVSVFVVSVCSLPGLVVAPWRRTRVYKYVLTVMLGLGVGALIGDACLHLIPQALDLHDHSSETSHSSSGVEPYVWKMLCTCLSIWVYFLLQLGLYTFGQSMDGKRMDDDDSCVNSSDHLEKDENDADSLTVHAHESVAWMVTFGDGVHNFADGLAIGAAYCGNWPTGLSTTIAVCTHELPQEFGDVAMLLSTGWSTKKVLIFQLLSQSTAFVGLYIGISISNNTDGAQQWIFAVTAGMFLYIALADVIPELIEFYKHYSRLHIAILSNVGIFIGYLALLLIAIFEDNIVINAN